MMGYDELKALIEKRGVHQEFGELGEGFFIEQNSHELAVFLSRMQELGIQSVLEIGTGWKGGLSRFLASDLQWDVTTYDIQNYGHVFTGVHYIVGNKPVFMDNFDLVFIDGDHSYENVMRDYNYYREYADKVIAFHDTAGLRNCEGAERFFGMLKATAQTHQLAVALSVSSVDIWPLANQISVGATPCFEVIDTDSKNYAGIGWIEL